ncbi:hypothetical protein DT075_36530 [Bacillus licheniformis]|nr:hypothetical protein DT075_36530 [Bacillus licheniformis]
MHKPGKPFNPMINAGALTVSSILPGESALGKMESLHDVIEKMIGKRLEINEEVFRSEWQLGKIDSNQLGICVIGSDQTMIKAGNSDVSFTLQSISKVISFIAACLTKGISYVLDRVDVEPTGDAFTNHRF